jgi:predicted PurR-regulated permease PerM
MDPQVTSPADAQDRPLWVIAVVLVAAVAFVLKPVLAALVAGGFTVLLIHPLFERWSARLGQRRIAAALTTLALVVVVFAPVGWLVYASIRDAIDAATGLTHRVQEAGGVRVLAERLPPQLRTPLLATLSGNEALSAAAAELAQRATRVLSSIGSLVAQSFLAIVTIYYLLVQGPALVRFLRAVSPLRPAQTEAFLREFRDVALGLFWGNVVTAVFHGVAGALGYLVFDIPKVLLLGALTGLASFVPILGTSAVWIPVVVGVALMGSPWRAFGLLLYSLVIVGGVDNILRPLVSKGHMALPNLLVFLTLFGGLQLWGAKGLLLGPLVGSLAVTALHLVVRARRRDDVDEVVPAT